MKLKLATIALLTHLWTSGEAQDAGAPPADPQVELSRAAQDLVGLAETGAAEDAQVTFINNSPDTFGLSADAIFYLRDQGISQTVLTAMLNHDKGIKTTPPPAPADDSATAYNYNQQAYPPSIPLSNAPSLTDGAQSPPAYQPPPPVYDSSSAPPDVSYFYDSLQPYGTWMVVGGDWCWQPRAVVLDRAWRPYCHGGHWVYSSADWCWQSDYSWGWAPFHYGRWDLRPGIGWVWLPGREWGPGWVTWRTDGDHCGWAPLPWHSDFVAGAGFRYHGGIVGLDFGFGLGVNAFTFIGLGDFGAHDYYHRSIRPAEAQRIFAHTTVINNYQVTSDHIVRNTGLPLARIEAATHTTFRPVPIRPEPAHEAGRPTGGVIYRHELTASPVQHQIVAQKIDAQHPMVYHAPISHTTPGPKQTGAPYQAGQPARDLRSTPATPSIGRQNYSAPPSHATTGPAPAQSYQGARTYTPGASTTTPSRYTSMNNVVQRQGTPVQTYAPQPPSHVYYPKSYQQANETATHSYSEPTTHYSAPVTHTYPPASESTPSGSKSSAPSQPSQPSSSHSGKNPGR